MLQKKIVIHGSQNTFILIPIVILLKFFFVLITTEQFLLLLLFWARHFFSFRNDFTVVQPYGVNPTWAG